MKISAAALAVTIAIVFAGIAFAAQQRDGAVIHNTGSTNFPGYTIKVWSDGSAAVVRSMRNGTAVGQQTTGRIPLELARKLFSDLKAAKQSGKVAGQACMKSASFGSSTVVQYHGWTSPDLECPGDGFVVALASEAHQIASLLNAGRGPVPRRLLPNEPRRPETLPSQATPMPESTPPTT